VTVLRGIVGSLWVRVAVTAGLLALVATGIDWDAVGDRLLGGDAGWFAVATGCVVAALLVGALRWRALLELAGVHLPVRELGRVYAVSTFSQSFLPTSVGGDVARALLVVRRGPLLARTASTVVVDRAGGLAGLLAVTWGAILLGGGRLPRDAVTGLAWATAAGAVLTAVAVLVLLRRPARLVRLVPARALEAARGAWRVGHDLLRSPRSILLLLVTSTLFQALVAAQIWALARCLGDTVSFPAAAVTLTLVTFATLVPLSIGGFGIREGSYAVLLGSVGISTTDATLISLGTVVVLLLASLPGAVLLTTSGMRPALEPHAT
jgi:uncharacterized membrane protein YbhN (UPF0104 family)